MRARVALSILIVVCLATANRAMGEPGELVFVPLIPCRLIDTRSDFATEGPTPSRVRSTSPSFAGSAAFPGEPRTEAPK